MPITALPAAPQSTDTPANFNTKAFAWVNALATFTTEANALETNVNTKEANVVTKEASAVAASAAAVAAANFKGSWSSLTGALNIPASVLHNGVVWLLNTNTAAVQSNQPGVSGIWTLIQSGPVGGATPSGSVTLVSTSAAAQALTPTSWGQSVTLPNATTMSGKGPQVFALSNATQYPMRLVNAVGTLLGFIPPAGRVAVDLIDNTTSAGVWGLDGYDPIGVNSVLETSGAVVSSTQATNGQYIPQLVVALSSTVRMVFGHSGSTYYAAVHDKSTGVFGPFHTITTASRDQVAAVAIDATRVLITYSTGSTNLSAAVLSVSGTSITVNTPVTATAGATVGSVSGVVAINGSYVFAHTTSTPSCRLMAVTVSGTVPTLGAQTTLGTVDYAHAVYVSGTQGLVFCTDVANSLARAVPFTVSGTTITVGTSASWANSSPAHDSISIPLGSRWVCVTTGVSALVSVSANVATASSFGTPSHADGQFRDHVSLVPLSATKLAICGGQALQNTSILTDSSGTASISATVYPALGNSSTRFYGPPLRVKDSIVTAMAQGYEFDSATWYTPKLAWWRVDCTGISPAIKSTRFAYTGSPTTHSYSDVASAFPAIPYSGAGAWIAKSRRYKSDASEMVLNRFGRFSYVLGGYSGVLVVGDEVALTPIASVPFVCANNNPYTSMNVRWLPNPMGVRLSEQETYVISGQTLYAVECVA